MTFTFIPCVWQKFLNNDSLKRAPLRDVDKITVSSINTSRWSQAKKPSGPHLSLNNLIRSFINITNSRQEVGDPWRTPMLAVTIDVPIKHCVDFRVVPIPKWVAYPDTSTDTGDFDQVRYQIFRYFPDTFQIHSFFVLILI